MLMAMVAGLSYFIYDTYFARKMMIASINPYNFTDVAVVDLFVNDTWGGSINQHSGGGSSVCCVMIPEKWRPGLVANIKWKKTEDEKWYKAQAEIPPYTESAGLQVLFLENNKVKVYVMDYWPCTPMHPMPKDKKLCGDSKKP
jgi:hypothetical protein